MSWLREQLELLAAANRERDLLPGYEYRSGHEFVLREGREFDLPSLPHTFPQGAPRHCFGNAINIAAMYDLPYVEGYATHLGGSGVPIHHAWNLDRDGRVIDVTWGAYTDEGVCVLPVGEEYIGVEFSVERADDASWNGDATVLDDWQRNWPILREKWAGEPTDQDWPYSPRLEAVRALKNGDLETARRLLVEGL